MTREEHLAWCKQRALEYVDADDMVNAFGLIVSDLGKHEGTQGHPAIQLGMMQMMIGGLRTSQEMRQFIEGIN